MKIVIAADTGQTGHILVRALRPAGQEIIVLTHNPHPTPSGNGSRVVTWNPAQVCDWSREVDGAEVPDSQSGFCSRRHIVNPGRHNAGGNERGCVAPIAES